jgi:hypothetical protein
MTFAAGTTTKWKAFKNNYTSSDTVTVLGVPTFSPPGGTYNSGQSVTITAPVGAQLKVFQPGINLLNPASWTTGTSGSQGVFSAIGQGEDSIEIRRTPYGTAEPIWVARNLDTMTGASYDADGGWNAPIQIDRTKLYRFSMWVRKVDASPEATSGSTYLGCGLYGWPNVSELTGTGTDSTNLNPYFMAGTIPLNEWCLAVGYVHPASDLGTTHYGRLYNSKGEIAGYLTDFRWLPTTTSTYHRAYLYYCTESGVQQEFWNPRVEVVTSVNDPIDVLFAPPESSPKTITLNGTGARTVQAMSYASTSVPSAVSSSQYQLVTVDTDGDCLPDSWEMQYFGNFSQSGAGDWDGDGISNLQEYQNGTNPASYTGLLLFTPLE